MRRRSMLRALLGTGTASALAGCNGLLGRDGGGSEPRADGRATSASSGTVGSSASSASSSTTAGGSAPSRPYRVAGAPALDRPRGVHVRNLASRDRFVSVVVAATDTEVFADSVTVPSADVVSFPNLLGTRGQYSVLVETADGARRRYDWTVREELDDLWIDLTPEIGFHRPVRCLLDCAFARGDGGVLAYDVPSDVGVFEVLRETETPALVVDNDSPRRQRATLRVWQGGDVRLSSEYAFPPDVRALVPVLPDRFRYDVLLRTDQGQAIYDWQPSARTTLYASLAGGPSFRCGYADHDVRVRNETGVAQEIAVRVFTGETTLFERSFDLPSNGSETVHAAVDPVGPLRFEVRTGDGRVEQFNWVRCAPNGPITLSVTDTDVSVSVRPLGESS